MCAGTVVAVLKVIAPTHRLTSRLVSFLEQKLPPGFPVRVNIPVFPTVSATVTFLEYSGRIPGRSFFEIPGSYKHDPEGLEVLRNLGVHPKEEGQAADETQIP